MKVDGYLIDCATEERLTYTATATRFPVEKGAQTSDHIITEMPVLEFDGIVSDTPIGKAANDPSRRSLGGGTLPSQDAYQFFLSIRQAEQPVTVECSYGTFTDMVMTSLTPRRDVATAKAFMFSATFEQIDIRETRRTTIRTATPGTGKKKNLGNQPVTKINGAAVDGVIYVITFPVAKREFATKGYGKPVATDMSFVVTRFGTDERPLFDCYRILAGRERNAEGFLTPAGAGGPDAARYQFHELVTLTDASTQTRRDSEGRDVTTDPAPKLDNKTPDKTPVKRGWWNAPEAK